jgi:hypothetical protein
VIDTPSDGPRPYGAQTPAVRRFLQRLAALHPDEWQAAAAEWEALVGTPAFARADRSLQQVIERAALESARDAALGPLLQLVRLPPPPGHPPDEPPPLAPVAEAALGAVLALVARDFLSASTFATLYAPFAARIPLDALEPPR